METIKNYLDNMFINFPKTPEVLRVKKDLAEMMEDKYNELIAEGKKEHEAIGIVISEFGSIQELTDELGIEPFQAKSHAANNSQNTQSCETEHKKEAFESEKISHWEFTKEEQTEEDVPKHVSAIEAEDYLFQAKQLSVKIAIGVFLCICSPVMVILLGGIQDCIVPIPDGIISGIGVSVLLVMVACAVGLFINAGTKLESYDYLKKECFTLDPTYRQSVLNMQEARKNTLTFRIILGVIMCILSVIPVIITASIFENTENEFPIYASVAFLLLMVGTAVSLFITASTEDESYKVILQEQEFTAKVKAGKQKMENISAAFWPLVSLIYLAWSFISGEWWITWVIWPLAGILFATLSKILICFPQKTSKGH